MHAAWDNGKMDGFIASAAVSGSDGHYVMGYCGGKEPPFYYWMASTVASADTYFGRTPVGAGAHRSTFQSVEQRRKVRGLSAPSS